MTKKIGYIFLILTFIFACQTKEKKEPEEKNSVEKVQADSMVTNDQQRADSMMKALKEKLK